MWVLEARENAETVWYPVVWETEKDASNVIDYNIREEQTLWQSSVFNANNDTTTGMANVIPWVNAPKLIASTSIYGIKWADPSTVVVTWYSSLWPSAYQQYQLTNFNYVSTIWNYWTSTNSLTIPEKWAYSIDFSAWDDQIWYTPNTWYSWTFYVKVNWTTVDTVTIPMRLKWGLNCAIEANKWDIITVRWTFSRDTATIYYNFELTVTKLW